MILKGKLKGYWNYVNKAFLIFSNWTSFLLRPSFSNISKKLIILEAEVSAFHEKTGGHHSSKLWIPLKSAQKQQQLQMCHFYRSHSLPSVSAPDNPTSLIFFPLLFTWKRSAYKAWNKIDQDKWFISSLLQFSKCCFWGIWEDCYSSSHPMMIKMGK